MSDAGRYVELEGCYNFRDLGGYRTRAGRRVREGRLFRSDALHHLTGDDVAHLRDALGLGHIIDVRSAREVDLEQPTPLRTGPVRYDHVPLFSEGRTVHEDEIPESLGDRYFLIARYARDPLRHVLELIASAPAPAVFHCAAGKDRTGIIAALVLGLLGVPEEDIVADYVATSHRLDQIIERLRTSPSYREIFDELPPETLHVEAETMETFLALLTREFGSIPGYTEWAGLDATARARLETVLLDTP